MSEPHCCLCKNRCSLSNPKCDAGRALKEKSIASANTHGHCMMCEKKCPYSDLSCSTGILMAKIKGWK